MLCNMMNCLKTFVIHQAKSHEVERQNVSKMLASNVFSLEFLPKWITTLALNTLSNFGMILAKNEWSVTNFVPEIRIYG